MKRLLPLLLVWAAAPALAQGPGSGGPKPGAAEPTTAPLDGGASLLLAAGTAYGLNKLRPRRAR